MNSSPSCLPIVGFVSLFNFSYSGMCSGISLSFKLAFPWWLIYFCLCLLSICMSFCDICLNFLPVIFLCLFIFELWLFFLYPEYRSFATYLSCKECFRVCGLLIFFFSPLVLLRYHWYTLLYKFKGYSKMTYIFVKWWPQ